MTVQEMINELKKCKRGKKVIVFDSLNSRCVEPIITDESEKVILEYDIKVEENESEGTDTGTTETETG